MSIFARRALTATALLVFAIASAGWFESEATQRKAFIGFLQSTIIDRSGVHVLKLSPDDEKTFGNYTNHYAIILNFASDPELTSIGAHMAQVAQKGALRTFQELIDRRADLRSVGDDLGKLLKALDQKLAAANAARAALKQPDDLKTVYNAAFDKVVTAPAQGFREAIPIAQNIASTAAKVGDYLDAHRDKIKLVGTTVQASDPKIQSEINALLDALNAYTPRFNEAQRKLGIIFQGS